MEILTTNVQIQNKIRWVLGDSRDERIVLVAFVGGEPEKFIDEPKDLNVYCWLKIPGTNPNGLRSLLANNVQLFAVKNLHTKLYWSRKRGAVVGSANLSKEALENRGQHELAIYLPPGKIDIHPLLKRFIASPIDKPTIDRFEEQYNLYRLRNKDTRGERPRTPSPRTFLKWCKLGGAPWSLYWWQIIADPPADAVNAVERETGSSYYHDYISSDSEDHYKLGEWVLSFRENHIANGDIRPSLLEWFIPQVRGKTETKKWKDYPYFWFQVEAHLPQVPFNLKDKTFKDALAKAINQFDGDVYRAVKKGTRPTKKFLDTLEKCYRELR